MKIISLMYHDVVKGKEYESSGFTGVGSRKYKVDYDKFVDQIRCISKLAKSSTFELSTIEEMGKIRDYSTVLLTFDDGGTSAYTCIADVLEKFGLRGYFFITAKYIDTPGFLSREQIAELRKRGHIIGTHSFSHPVPISKLKYKEILEEWGKSISILSEILGEEIYTASVPGGYTSIRVIEAARQAGIKLLFTSEKRTKVKFKENMVILGRFTVYGGMSNKAVCKLASGGVIQQLTQWISSNVKKILKTLLGRAYLKVRQIILK